MEKNKETQEFLEQYDALMERDGEKFAGLHVTIDLYDAKRLDDIEYMKQVMEEIVDVCGAHLLHIHLHHFTPTYGITGVAVLSESHISVHTWPERSFAAFDVFMCGKAKPELAIELLEKRFEAKRVVPNCYRRGNELEDNQQ